MTYTTTSNYLYLQFCWQVAGRIILVPNDVITSVDGLKQWKCISNTEDGGQAPRQQFPGWWSRVLCYLIGELVYELLLTLFDVGLKGNYKRHTRLHIDLAEKDAKWLWQKIIIGMKDVLDKKYCIAIRAALAIYYHCYWTREWHRKLPG